MTTLLKTAFHPDYGLFCETETHQIYPNPISPHLPGHEDRLNHYMFLGMVVGKALYEEIVLENQFAHFFLRKMLGQTNLVEDLMSLDSELYRHLLFLRTAEGDLSDLELTFAVNTPVLDQVMTFPLKKGGTDITVTQENKIEFMYLMANFKLNFQIRKQADRFLEGLRRVIPLDVLSMFAADEIGLLLSGQGSLDLDDLRANTVYANGFNDNSQEVKWFWSIVKDDFSDEQRRKLLRFVTSCGRAPLLGFQQLNPKFCIQSSNAGTEDLPTAATCVNLLRIPRYETRDLMVRKLLYAIESNSGFGLS